MSVQPASITVGVDAGGTSTEVIVARDGAVVRHVKGPEANASAIGIDDAADAIIDTIRRALEHERPSAISVGAAGAGRERVARALEELIQSAFPDAAVRVGDDTEIALRASIPDGPGIVLIAGTGSVAYAENGDKRARVGGLGSVAGDEGSAYAIGMAAVRLYGRVLDGRIPEDETTALVARTLEAPDRDAYLDAMYDRSFTPSSIAALAPPIIAFAGNGNRNATKIVQQASLELGDLVKSAAKLTALTNTSPAVAFAGGLLAENSLLSFLLETRIVGDIPGVLIVRGGGDGAAVGALRLAGVPATP